MPKNFNEGAVLEHFRHFRNFFLRNAIKAKLLVYRVQKVIEFFKKLLLETAKKSEILSTKRSFHAAEGAVKFFNRLSIRYFGFFFGRRGGIELQNFSLKRRA